MAGTRKARNALWCALQNASQDLPQATTTRTAIPFTTRDADGSTIVKTRDLPNYDLKALNLDGEFDIIPSLQVSLPLNQSLDDSDCEDYQHSGDSNNNCPKN